MIARHTNEFKEEMLAEIERNYMRYWEQLGIDGATGSDKFNAPAWIFNMKNRFKWSDRQTLETESDNPFEVKLKLIE